VTPLLATALLPREAAHLGRAAPTLPARVLEALCAHPWPGNVRELVAALRHFALLGRLPPEVTCRGPGPAPRIPDRAALVREAVARAGGNKAAAARALGVARMTLHRWLTDTGVTVATIGPRMPVADVANGFRLAARLPHG